MSGTGVYEDADVDATRVFGPAGLKEIAECLSGTLTKSTDAIVQDDIEGPAMKPRKLLRFE
ncbi:protein DETOXIFICATION 45 chloroplastic [Prunus yedoensis var. nudiflora]|uniref:Protein DETOXIFICATION 45 chloroplastic n=1 Tax=Prunus yedoensis var. nudiflora TaxID=2094558 RepID=A0A314XF02_PRUYE|nr:protein DETOXIFICATION 45 chloroplastic [Prunus yedoensis var. nudiflora]